MVQAPQKTKMRRGKVNLTMIFTFSFALVLLVIVGIFFRFGEPPKDAPNQISAQTQQKIAQLFAQTDQLRKQGKQKEAVIYGQQLINLLEREKVEDWMMLLMAYLAESDMQRELGQWDIAADLIKRAKAVVEAHHLEEQNLTCEVLLREGIFKFASKDYRQAEEYFEQALSCSETMTGHLSVESSAALLWVAENCLTPAFDNPQKALQYLRTVEEVSSSAQPERPQQLMTCLKIEGMAFSMMKKFTEAEEKFLASQEIAERIYPNPENSERKQLSALLKRARESKSQTH